MPLREKETEEGKSQEHVQDEQGQAGKQHLPVT